MSKQYDAVVIGAGHNGLVAACLLAESGLRVAICEEASVVGGACRTEQPFSRAPELRTSTGAYLLGLMPPELLHRLQLTLPLVRRDPHYFLPTTDTRSLLFGSNRHAVREQFLKFFSEADWNADVLLNEEIAALRDDLAPAWLEEPETIEGTAERFIRPELREVFIRLCRGSIDEYLQRFDFKSDLIRAMYAVTDAFSGLHGGFETPGTGMNFLVHNMCRLPRSGGTWMIVRGGMGTITQQLRERAEELGASVLLGAKVTAIDCEGGSARGVHLADGREIRARVVLSNADPFRTQTLVPVSDFDPVLSRKLEGLRRDGSTLKINLAFRELPTFRCLPEDRGQFGPTIHLLPDESSVIDELRRAHAAARSGELPEFPAIEWYFHTPLDPGLRDAAGHHNSALFVQWVPYELSGGRSWDDVEERYVQQLLAICDRFAPGASELVADSFTLSPVGIERHFGITRGHIHHIDNGFGFSDRAPYRFGIQGLYLCSAGTHPAGSVIGAAGHNAAFCALRDLGLEAR